MAAVQAAAARVLHVSPRAANLEDREGKPLKGRFWLARARLVTKGLDLRGGHCGRAVLSASRFMKRVRINEDAAVTAFADQAGFVAQAGD